MRDDIDVTQATREPSKGGEDVRSEVRFPLPTKKQKSGVKLQVATLYVGLPCVDPNRLTRPRSDFVLGPPKNLCLR